MKRIFVLLILVGLVVPTAGCRLDCLRNRGARCRSSAPVPSFQMPRTFSQPSAYGQECNQPVYVQPGGMSTGDSYSSGNVIMDQFPTGPIQTEGEMVQRPIVSSDVMNGIQEGSVITVPGPESAPLPLN